MTIQHTSSELQHPRANTIAGGTHPTPHMMCTHPRMSEITGGRHPTHLIIYELQHPCADTITGEQHPAHLIACIRTAASCRCH